MSTCYPDRGIVFAVGDRWKIKCLKKQIFHNDEYEVVFKVLFQVQINGLIAFSSQILLLQME